MAAYGWRKSRSVAAGLAQEGHRFRFLQAVRLIEAMRPEAQPVGESVEPEREAVRFSSTVRLDFPASEVERVELPTDANQPARVDVNLMGIAGVLGPLPPPFTELILRRRSRKDHAFGDFLDLFNHRLLSIFYRAKKKFRPALGNRSPDQGRVARVLYSLLGLGTGHLRERLHLPDRSLLRFTGLMVRRSRSMAGLARIVGAHFGVTAQVVPFRGRWLHLDEDQHTRIGRFGANQVLGESALLGRRAWDQQAGFELVLSGLTEKQLVDLLPTGEGFHALCSLTRFYAGDELDFDVRLEVASGEAPEFRLGQAGDGRLGWSARLGGHAELKIGSAGGARLGWTTWLGARHDAAETPAAAASSPTLSVTLAGVQA